MFHFKVINIYANDRLYFIRHYIIIDIIMHLHLTSFDYYKIVTYKTTVPPMGRTGSFQDAELLKALKHHGAS